MKQNIKLDQLRYFVAVANLESLTRAASILRVSASALSHSISALESELGYVLFEKSGRKIFLTTFGRNLLPKAKKILADVESLQDAKQTQTTHLRLSATHGECHRTLSRACASRLKQTSITAHISCARSSQIIAKVLSGSVDIGFCYSPLPHPELTILQLVRGTLLLAVRKGHPLLSEKNILSKLQMYPSVSPDAAPGIEICSSHPQLETLGVRVKPQFTVDNYDASIEIISNSECWGLVPEFLTKNNRKLSFISVPVNWNAGYTICAVYLKRYAPPQELSTMTQEFTKQLE